MKTPDINESYSRYYEGRVPKHVYPTEFVVRAFLGKYPRLSLDKAAFRGARVLDLGFGDGRNTGFLCQQGFQVYGTEITQQIVDLAKANLADHGHHCDLRVGRNNALPFENDFFDYVLACHACYYLDEGTDFDDNLREIQRVIKKGGWLIASVPGSDNHTIQGAESLARNIYRIRRDVYGIRNGCLVAAFPSADLLKNRLQPFFEDIRIGTCDNDFWGVREQVHIFAARRR